MNPLNKAIKIGLSPLAIPEPKTLSRWADDHFYLSAESSSIEGKWVSLPNQIALLDWIGNDDIEILDFIKSARLGYTKMILAAVGYFAEHKRRNQLFYQPTDGDAEDFVKSELNTMLRDVQVVRDVMQCDPEVKSPANTNSLKKFHGSLLDIKGGKSGRNYRRMTKDVVYYDELDGFDLDIDGEGSPLVLGDNRTTTSSFPKSVRGSTPLIEQTSMIEASIKEADAIFERYVPCPDCQHMQPLKWEQFIFDSKQDGGDVGHACASCGSVSSYLDLPTMDKAGQWRTDTGIRYEESLGMFQDEHGDYVPPPYHIGARCWVAYSYFQSWEKTVKKFLSANKELKRGNYSKMKTFVNTDLGQSWQDKGDRVNVSFPERQEDYHPEKTIPNGVLVITMWADVQGGKDARLELEIVGWGLGNESWSLDYVVITGDPKGQAVWDHLDDQRARKYTRDDGAVLSASGCGVDAGYLSSEVYKYTGPRKRQHVYATMGSPTNKGPLVSKPRMQGDKARALLYVINTHEAKELIYGRLDEVDEPGPGYCHFPNHYDKEFFDMLTAEEKITRYKKGFPYTEWRKIRARNEALDCRVGNVAILHILNPNLPRIKQRFEDDIVRKSLGLEQRPVATGRRVRSMGARG